MKDAKMVQDFIQVIISSLASILGIIALLFLIFKGKKGVLRTIALLFAINQLVWSSAYVMEYTIYLSATPANTPYLTAWLPYINYYKFAAINTFVPLNMIVWLCYCFKTLNKLEQRIYQYKWILFIPGIICYALLPTTLKHGLIYYARLENGVWVVYLGLAQRIYGYIPSHFRKWPMNLKNPS